MIANGIDQYRSEIKFICALHERHRLDVWMRYSDASFRECYAERVINNIYFDTLQMRDYYDNVIGLSNRVKTRLRWYGETEAPGSMFLEQKIKRGKLSRKRSFEINGLDLGRITRSLLSRHLDDVTRKQSGLVANCLMNPTVRNVYLRRYYRGRDGMRMTIDSDLKVYEIGAGAVLWRGLGLSIDRWIVEFKVAVGQAERLQRILKDIPLRVSRCSKYVVGVDVMRNRGEQVYQEA